LHHANLLVRPDDGAVCRACEVFREAARIERASIATWAREQAEVAVARAMQARSQSQFGATSYDAEAFAYTQMAEHLEADMPLPTDPKADGQ
jgi:hypothetical protein